MANLSKTTQDHEEIRRWAEERGAHPSCVKGTGDEGDIGLLRLDFPGFSGEQTLQHIGWDDWFEKFDERNLALLYQEETAGGERSNFNKIVSAETAAEAESGSHRKASTGRSSTHSRKSTSRGAGSSMAKRSRGSAKKSATKTSSKKAGAKSTTKKSSAKKSAARSKKSGTKTPSAKKTASKKSAAKTSSKKTASRGSAARKSAKKPAKRR